MTLFEAAAAGDLERVRSLLAGGAAPDERDAAGQTALQLAAESGQTEMVRMLLAAGADPTAREIIVPTAITGAILNGHDEVVRTLVAAAAERSGGAYPGELPLHEAVEAGHGNV